MMRFGKLNLSALLPLALSIITFVLSFLLLFAGHKEGFMEEYALIRLNTSTLGYDMVPGSDEDEDRDGIRGWFDDVADDAADFLNDITNDVADRLADELGISQWYSVHMMTLCRGDFEPNATDSDPSFDVTSCTESSPNNRINLTRLIDNELEAGPVTVTLADIDWPDEVEDAIEIVNEVLLALLILYSFAIAFSGLTMLVAGAAVILGPDRPKVAPIGIVLTTLGTIVLFAASLGVTIGGRIGVDRINDHGDRVGISATEGSEFVTLTWVAFAMIFSAMAYWVVVLCVARRNRKRGSGFVGAKEWRT